MEELLSVDEFAEKIKSKYPAYASMDNLTLVQKIIAKYPQYKNQVDMSMVSTDVAVEEAPEVDIAQNNAIINSTMVGETPFTELREEDQEKYITRSGNYATDKDGNLLFVPRNKQEVDEVWNYPKDSSGRRYFPDMPFVETETETEVVEEEKPSENIFDFSRSGVRGANPRDPNVEILSTYVLGNSQKSTVNVNGQRVLPGNIKKDAKDIEVSVEDETLNLLNINKQDYVNWERENFRKEDKAFGFFQGLLRPDSSEKKAIDKRNAEKLSGYLLTLGNSVEKDLEIVQAKLKSTTDPVMRAQLLADEELLKTDLLNNLNSRIKLVKTNDYLRNEKESQVELNKETFLNGQSEGPVSSAVSGLGHFLQDAWNVGPSFFGTAIRLIPSLPDQVATIAGYDDKGFLAATDEALGSLQDFISFDRPERSAFVDGKKVYSVVNGQNHPFIVTKDGRIIDEITHVDMEGILTDTQYQSILKGAEGEKTETFASAGGFAQNFTSTVVNLFALIRSGQWITKGINRALKKGGSKTTVGGGVGMGSASYASTAVGEVEDIRATLVRSGLSEKDAMKYAIAAGNSRATLDGIFSGLAGSNVKLIEGYKGIGKSIVDIAKKPSTWAKKGVFQQKVKDLVKENAKELFVEELPVLYTGKGINALVNYTLEEDILSDRASNAEFYETVAMTIGATSGLGSTKLLTGNSRSSLIDIASHAPDLKKTIDKLVAQGMITKQEGVAAYDEIYAMQIANNNSNGAVMMPANKVKYSDLAAQRKDLVTQEKNLDGPGKERVRKKIEAIDAELEALIVKDEAEVKAESEKVPEKSSNLEAEEVTVTDEEVIEEIKKRKPDSDVYTEEELEIVRKELIKTKQDAVQESSPEGVDVQKPTRDGETVGEGDTKGVITPEGSQEVKDASQEKPKTEVIVSEEKKQKLGEANSVVKKIKRLIRKKDAPAEVVDAAKEFIKLNPDNINDLDGFIKNANAVVEGLTPVKTGRKGEIKISGALDVTKIDQYTKEEQAAQEKFQAEADQRAFADLTGLDPKDFTLDELRRILYHFETNNLSPEEKAKLRETKKGVIAQGLKNAFNKYASVVDKIVKTGVDPFTGDKVKLSAKDLKLAKEFLEIDISKLPAENAAEALGAMVNFATNQSIGGLEAVVNFAKGRKNAADYDNVLKAKPLKLLIGGKLMGDLWNKWIASLPQTMEQMFKSQRLARIFEKVSGFTDIRNGVAKAEKIAQNISEAYYDKFINPGGLRSGVKLGNTKTMPNGKRFNDVENDIERGLFAFMRRTVDGTKAEQDAEFNRRKKLITQSIKELENNGQTEKAKNYQKVYDKLLKNSNSIDEVDKKTDPINKEAVDWMTSEWTKARPELEDVSLSIYNRTLGKDINYTPDSFSRLDGVESEPDLDAPLFQPDMNQSVYDKETGVLMPKKPSNVLPMEGKKTTRYVNLGFDSNNANNLRSAYTDVNTAPGIQQLKGFMSSPSFEKIIPNIEDRKLIKNRFQAYVQAKRGLTPAQSKIMRRINRLAGLGVSRVLGGPTQYVKQLVPLINTLMNTLNDLGAFRKGFNAITFNTDANAWLDNSGVEIVNRGIQSITNLEGTDTKLENDLQGKAGKFEDGINKLQKFWLQNFLIHPDRFAARASFMAYYLEALNKKGIQTTNIDWKTHKANQSALDYATQQVGRQQNTSDVDLQGELFSSKKPALQILRKVAFPFANFLLNQKTRMYNDLGSVFSKSNTSQDKFKSAKSLGGLAAEGVLFNAVGLFVTQSLATIAKEIRGTDEDEETLLKQFENRQKGRAGQFMADVVSPIPYFNPEVTEGVNLLIQTFDSEDPFQFFVNRPETLPERLGVLGIPVEKAGKILEMVYLGTTGKYRDKYGREITIDPQYKDDVLAMAPFYTLYLLGFFPLEAGSIMDYSMRAYLKTREEKPRIITPPKKKSKKPKRGGGPISPFKGRRKKTGPRSPF